MACSVAFALGGDMSELSGSPEDSSRYSVMIRKILEQVEAFSQHEFGHRISFSGDESEVQELAGALNALGEELRSLDNAWSVLRGVNSKLWIANKKLQEIARIDPLTSLLNHRGLEQALLSEAERARREDTPISAVLIDCDNFKQVNDDYGHSVGNQVLQTFSKRMTGAVRQGDYLGRVGGDEFMALMPHTRFHEALIAAERMRLSINHHPLRLNDSELHITVSMGVTTLPGGVNTVEEALSLTRLALKRSKRSGKNRVSGRFMGVMTSAQQGDAHTELLEKLRSAEYYRAVAQPILTANDEQIIGHELLSRCQDGPYTMPSEFFRIATESDMLTEVDLTCAAVCMQEAAERKLSGRLHVNLFPSTLLSTEPERLLSIFPEKRKGETYCVEISEQQFIGDPGALKQSLSVLKDAGVLVAVDDVGFGRTSLETLLVLEPDIIKIDRHYIAGIADDRVKSHRLERMVDAVGKLGAELVAEGVESREDLEVLNALELPYAQGYLWGMPL